MNMADTPTLVRFFMGWADNGLGRDGLPLYKEQLMIQLDRPPLLSLNRVATEEEIEEYPGPYALFQKEQKSRKTASAAGYPLVMWPACTEAEFKMLAARDIVTVEQLAKLAGRKADIGMPAEIRELAERAAELLKMQASGAKFETVIRDLQAQVEVLREQVEEGAKTIASQKSLIDTLKMRVA
jgi:hypothetical protein